MLILVISIYMVLDDIDMKAFMNIFSQIRWEWVLLSLPVAILSHWVRAVRWKIFLQPILHAKSYLNLFSAVMVGYAVNNIIPRGGELVRPFVYARREKVSKTAVFATIIVERVIDVLFLLLMFGIVFFFNKNIILQAFPQLSTSVLTYFLVILAFVIFLLFIIITTNIFEKLLHLIVRPVAPKYYGRICDMWASFRTGFEIIKTPSQYLSTFTYSALIWLLYALPMYLMFFCFDFQNLLHLTMADAGLLIVVSGVGMSIAPTPGGIGVYHWLIVTALRYLYPAISEEEALAYATLTHGVNLILQVLVGIIFLIREKENLFNLPTKTEFSESEA